MPAYNVVTRWRQSRDLTLKTATTIINNHSRCSGSFNLLPVFRVPNCRRGANGANKAAAQRSPFVPPPPIRITNRFQAHERAASEVRLQ